MKANPGTYKDCYIAEVTPHSLIEGKIIASMPLAHRKVIFIRANFITKSNVVANKLFMGVRCWLLRRKYYGAQDLPIIWMFILVQVLTSVEKKLVSYHHLKEKKDNKIKTTFSCSQRLFRKTNCCK